MTRYAPNRSRPPPSAGCDRNLPTAPATSRSRILRAISRGIRKLVSRKRTSVSAMRSLLRGTIAVWGIDKDRKSVVEGKSVAVRVDLGGRRNNKKKKKYKETQ